MDPNSHFDPTTQLVLNPNAWTDAPLGQFGTSAAYYNNFRWQRQPAESMSFGRLFPFGKEGRYSIQVRAEFLQHLEPPVLFHADARRLQQPRYADR